MGLKTWRRRCRCCLSRVRPSRTGSTCTRSTPVPYSMGCYRNWYWYTCTRKFEYINISGAPPSVEIIVVQMDVRRVRVHCSSHTHTYMSCTRSSTRYIRVQYMTCMYIHTLILIQYKYNVHTCMMYVCMSMSM